MNARPSSLIAGLLSAWLVAALATASQARIIVSGDLTPVFSITDTSLNPATPGNVRFFTNVLGAGTSVAVLSPSGSLLAGDELNAFYNGLSGVSSSLVAGPEGSLAGVDLFLVPGLPTALSASAVGAVADFLDAGGTLFLMSDTAGGCPSLGCTANANALLTGLGSSMQIGAASLDAGAQVATGSQIADHPLTAGVTAFNYGATAPVSGGTTLFFTSQTDVAFVQTDQAATAASEPGTLSLLALGLTGLALRRRRRPA